MNYQQSIKTFDRGWCVESVGRHVSQLKTKILSDGKRGTQSHVFLTIKITTVAPLTCAEIKTRLSCYIEYRACKSSD